MLILISMIIYLIRQYKDHAYNTCAIIVFKGVSTLLSFHRKLLIIIVQKMSFPFF